MDGSMYVCMDDRIQASQEILEWQWVRVRKAEWKRQRICEILLHWTDKHRERKMNRMRRRHTDGIKAFTIFSYRCVRRHVSPPYFMVILQIFGVALLILIHTWWAVLIEPLLLATQKKHNTVHYIFLQYVTEQRPAFIFTPSLLSSVATLP